MGASFSHFHFRAQKKGDREEEEMNTSTRRRQNASDGESVKQYSRKRGRIASCTSPSSTLTRCSDFIWYDVDIWTEVAKFLDGRDLVVLAIANKWFHSLMTDDSIWKFACLRDLRVSPPDRHVSSKWQQIYAAAFDGSHSYSFRQQEKHIDWMRIGAFTMESPVALLMEKLAIPRKLPEVGGDQEKHIQTSGICLLTGIRTGIWIADLQLVRCPVCNLDTCEGTMQLLEARHLELFLEEGYLNGSWNYVELGTHCAEKPSIAATGAIFDFKHLTDPSTAGILDAKSWVGSSEDWQPKAKLSRNAVAVNTNLQPNDGLQVRFQEMRSGDGRVVSMRISQQLI